MTELFDKILESEPQPESAPKAVDKEVGFIVTMPPQKKLVLGAVVFSDEPKMRLSDVVDSYRWLVEQTQYETMPRSKVMSALDEWEMHSFVDFTNGGTDKFVKCRGDREKYRGALMQDEELAGPFGEYAARSQNSE